MKRQANSRGFGVLKIEEEGAAKGYRGSGLGNREDKHDAREKEGEGIYFG